MRNGLKGDRTGLVGLRLCRRRGRLRLDGLLIGCRLRAQDHGLWFGYARDLRGMLQEVFADRAEVGLEHRLSAAGVHDTIKGLVTFSHVSARRVSINVLRRSSDPLASIHSCMRLSQSSTGEYGTQGGAGTLLSTQSRKSRNKSLKIRHLESCAKRKFHIFLASTPHSLPY
jgi:hypothetical protein